MISAEWNKRDLDNFYNKMDKIIRELPKRAEIGLNQALENTQEKALSNKRGFKDKKLILYEIVERTTNQVIGRVYTDKDLFSYAPFLEYGTGTKAEKPHIGKTKTFIESGYQYWYLPVEKASREFSPQRVINIKGKLFYIMYATRPYPFMRPASISSRQENADCINEEIGKLFVEVLK